MNVKLGLATFWKVPWKDSLRNLWETCWWTVIESREKKRLETFASHEHLGSILLTFPKEAIYMNDLIFLILIGPAS